jgi:hypothetical protein
VLRAVAAHRSNTPLSVYVSVRDHFLLLASGFLVEKADDMDMRRFVYGSMLSEHESLLVGIGRRSASGFERRTVDVSSSWVFNLPGP